MPSPLRTAAIVLCLFASAASAQDAKAPPAPPPPQPATRAVEPSSEVDAPALRPGLVGAYYRDVKQQPPGDAAPAGAAWLVKVDPAPNAKLDDDTFNGSKLAADFAVRWAGVLKVERPGVHRFTLKSDDGSRLYIGGQLAVDNSGMHDDKREPSADLDLKPGHYPLVLSYHQGNRGASVALLWTPPGGKREPVPAANLFHAPEQAHVPWDRAAFDAYTFDRKAWVRENGPPWEKMDYGPFLSATVEAAFPEKNVTNKAVAVQLDGGNAGVAFDTETGRYAAGWTGGFLKLTGVAFDGSHGPNPTPRGTQLFGTKVGPGWANASGSFDDPRPNQLGPLPKEWFKYKGLYRHGDNVVFSYSVNGVDVLDMPRFGRTAMSGAVFDRVLEVAPSSRPLKLLLANNPPGDQWAVTKPVSASATGDAASVDSDGGPVVLTIPPHSAAVRVHASVYFGRGVGGGGGSDDTATPSELIRGGPARWGDPLVTAGTLGTGDGAYVVDTLTAPEDNPFHSWLRFAGIDFFADGRVAVCTWSGDVWVVSGVDASLKQLKWQRYATGLFQALGLRIVNDQLYVLGRDQITRLHDLNADGEADFYENFNNDCFVSPSFHEFSLDLQTDAAGNFYYAKGGPVRPGGRGWQQITDHNGSVLRVSADGSKFDVFARGVRAPNGMGVSPDGKFITVADNEGTWTPTCRLSFVNEGDFLGVPDFATNDPRATTYGNPVCWLPHGEVDNSSGGQVWVPAGDRWGPLGGQLLHMSYGKCALYLVMPEQVGGTWQGGVVRFPLQFATGICRGRFNPLDGQLYVTGLKGWQTTAAKDGAVQRVRYTGKPLAMPVALRADADGFQVTFSGPLDKAAATDGGAYGAERWNYLWSSEYGSPEVSVLDAKRRERDPVDVTPTALSADGRTVNLKVDDMRPAMQYKIQMDLKTADGAPLEATVYATVNTTGPDSRPPGVLPATRPAAAVEK